MKRAQLSPGYLADAEEDVGSSSAALLEKLLGFPPVGCVDFMLTTKCNMNCDYCFVEGKTNGHTMSPTLAKQAVDFIFEHSGNRQVIEIVLFGGEPMLCFNLIRDTVVPATLEQARARNKQVTFSMTTNGTLLKESNLEFLRENNIKFLISIDGLPESHDRHRRMLNGGSSAELLIRQVPLFKSFQPWLGARMTVHPDAVPKIAYNVRSLYRLGFNQIIIGPAFGPAWEQSALDEFDRQLVQVAEFDKQRLEEKAFFRIGFFESDLDAMTGQMKHLWGCGAAGGRIAITPTGEIFGCAKLATLDHGRGKWRLGTVDGGFTRVGTRLALMAPPYSSRTRCHDCSNADNCRGGCPATNYVETGSPVLPSELDCRMTRLCTRVHKLIYQITPANRTVVIPCVSDQLP